MPKRLLVTGSRAWTGKYTVVSRSESDQTMSDHYVTVTGTPDDPEIAFECRGTRESDCHNYPACDCESWNLDTHRHPSVTHDECWLQAWFDADCIDPSSADGAPDYFADLIGKSGPIIVEFVGDYVEWSFDE